jgi:hypothetical protein
MVDGLIPIKTTVIANTEVIVRRKLHAEANEVRKRIFSHRIQYLRINKLSYYKERHLFASAIAFMTFLGLFHIESLAGTAYHSPNAYSILS